jgi:hypothetical protein
MQAKFARWNIASNRDLQPCFDTFAQAILLARPGLLTLIPAHRFASPQGDNVILA